jgi:glutamine cyclotransferase
LAIANYLKFDMKKFSVIVFAVFTMAVFALVCLHSCKNKEQTELSITPDAGTKYKLGEVISVKVSGAAADSVVYLMDSVKIISRKDTLAAQIKTDSLICGSRLITAKVYKAGKLQEVSTNVIIMPSAAPVEYTYKVDKVFPHDTASFTEGLEYHDGGYFYESTGMENQSYLLKVDLLTGKRLQSAKLDSMYFGEGIATVGDKIFMLTYKEGKAFIYDKNTFKLLSTIPYTWGKEGWGVCFDGKHILNDDSTNRIFFLNKDTVMPESYIDVYDDKGPVNAVNELEYIDGKIYANIWQTDIIIVINPKNGAVLQRIDLSTLYPQAKRTPPAEVLNGIAWDAKGKRLFITGKKWQHVYQVTFSKK